MNLFTKLCVVCVAVLLAAACSSTPKSEVQTKTAVEAKGKAGPVVNSKSQASNSFEKSTTCKNGADTRVLEISKKGNGCELAYTKSNEKNVIASAVNGNTHCETVYNRIQTRLTEANFKCE